MATRLPAPAPELPGFTHLRVLGVGGFADVHLYAQDRPQREVAIKVLLGDVVNPQLVVAFNAEADIMATLGAHPSVLTVYQSGIAPDGRPYIVTEYCPSGFGETFRQKQSSVSEVLTIGIKMASALESAHRLDVIHRDVKPGNVLVTAFGQPVLSDFGIATSLRDGLAQQVIAMSVPWTAPEVIAGKTTGTVATDVWGLSATLYSLLAGYSPFEVSEKGENSREKLAKRILRSRPTAVSRADVPMELAQVLGSALAKDPLKRPATMLEFARLLQDVQRSQSLTITPIELDVVTNARPEIDFANTSSGTVVRSSVVVATSRKRSATPSPAVTPAGLPDTVHTRRFGRSVRVARSTGWLVVAIVALAGIATLFVAAILGAF